MQFINIDNSWIVPHSPELIRKFNGHMNAEPCISKVGSIKYLFKYVCKGSNQVTLEVRTHNSDENQAGQVRKVPAIDEIKNYQDARSVSASEAAWRLFSFPMVEHHPPVERLEVHLEGNHEVYFEKGKEASAILIRDCNPTKLLAWFTANEKLS